MSSQLPVFHGIESQVNKLVIPGAIDDRSWCCILEDQACHLHTELPYGLMKGLCRVIP